MEATERDSTQDWLIPEGSAPPLLSELGQRIDEALVIARSSEKAVVEVGAAALDAAQQAQNIFGGQPVAVFVVPGHSRHSRRASAPRRIHDFTVPSGTPSRAASSLWLSPCT